MKTMIDIADPILERARKVATREGTTSRSLVERGLRHVLAVEGETAAQAQDTSVKGVGSRPELQNAGWDERRELIYDGQGG